LKLGTAAVLDADDFGFKGYGSGLRLWLWTVLVREWVSVCISRECTFLLP